MSFSPGKSSDHDCPRVAVIIPAYNEEDVIEGCLQGLISQTYPNFKAYLIDDASTDRTAALIAAAAAAHPERIALVQYGKVGPGRARNRVAAEVSADIFAFTDADCIPTATWLEFLVKGFASDPALGSVGGPHLAPPAHSNDFQRAVEKFFAFASGAVGFYKSPAMPQGEQRATEHNPLCNVAYRSELFLSLKGFREDLFPGEDVEIDFRVHDAGHKIAYQPRALVYHHRPEDLERFRKVMRAYGRSQGRLVREYGLRRRIQVVGAVMVVGFAALSLASILLLNPVGILSSAIVGCFYFGPRPRGQSFPILAWNSLEWLNGFVLGLVRNRQN